MAETSISLTDDEKAYLVRALELRFDELRVEEHHTRTPTYRDAVKQEEGLVRGVLSKLGKTA